MTNSSNVQQFEKIVRPVSKGADEWLGKPILCLNDGFLRLVDYMGSDESIVQAARVSYGKGTKKVSEDIGLIRYLMRHRHTTPFEMCEFKFHVRVPMDCWRQWIRHRTASVNEYSTRYSEAIDSAQQTAPEKWRKQSSNNKMGSGELFGPAEGKELSIEERQFLNQARSLYESRVAKGMAREQARKDLPLSTYTEAYWKIDLHNLFHFLGLRLDSHAQYEIRVYAQAIAKILKDAVPMAYQAFEDYRLQAIGFSGPELKILNSYLWPMNQKAATEIALAVFQNKRETEEFIQKLSRFNELYLKE